MKMERNKSGLVLYTLLFFIIPLTLFPQIKIHKHLTTQDGLVNGQVSIIKQDSKGYLWFGTFGGVSRWDGINFMNLQTHNGLPASQILSIEESADSSIYIATYGGGVIKYRNGKLDTINSEDGLLTNNITSIKTLSSGEILFAGDEGNISKLKNNQLLDWSKEIGFPKKDIFNIYTSPEGIIYFATSNGLVIVNNDSVTTLTVKDGLNSNILWFINGNKQGTIYIGTYSGLNILKDGKISSVSLNGKPFVNAIYNIQVTEKGKVYCATNAGVLVVQENKTELITTENGLISNDQWALLEGKNGLLYFGSNGKGVSIFNPKETITNYNIVSELNLRKIYSIEESKNGIYYFGTRNGLVEFKDNKFSIIKVNEGERSNIIELIYRDRNDNLLLGTKKGLKVLKNNYIKPYMKNKELLDNEIYTIDETGSGELLVGTLYGVFSIKGKRVEKVKYFDSLGSVQIMSIMVSKNDDIYFGSFDKGIYIFNGKKYINLTTKDGLSSDRINSIHQSKSGSILVGTQKGLNIINNQKVTAIIDVNNGLTNNVIADINEDEMGRIFVSTFKGVNIIENLNDSLTIRSITQKDGLTDDNCIINGSYLDSSGNLWIATQGGITKYNPQLDKVNRSPPKIYLSGLQIYNEEFPFNQFENNLNFEHDQNYLKFIYTGINLSAPEQIKYKYRLSDVDKDWVTSEENNVQYTNLVNGNYTFEVKAKNEWGYWSDPVSLTFNITPAWWQTWWFYILVFFAIGLLIAFVVSYRYRGLLAIEKMRSKISSDLHDSIGSGLTEIAFISEMLKPQIADNKLAVGGISTISKKSRKLVDDMRDIVWLVNPSKDSLKDLFLRLQDSYQETLKHSDINILVENIEKLESIKLSMILRQNIFLIFKEAINNAVKYSKCTKILVDVETNGKNLIISCSDNGMGFDKKIIKYGNGLKNMEKRAKQTNGNIAIQTEKESGTKIIFTGKIGKF